MIRPTEGTLAKVLNVPIGQGAIVNQVLPGSPAAKAGVQSQDVILDFNGQKVAGTKELQGIVERLDVGKTYTMTVVRDGKHISLPVTVETMPNRDRRWQEPTRTTAPPTKNRGKRSPLMIWVSRSAP